jgi:hypothetical protein
LLKHIGEMEAMWPDCPIAGVSPELVKERWWDYLLHSYRAQQLRTALLRDGGPNLVVVMVPWVREEPHPVEGHSRRRTRTERPATAGLVTPAKAGADRTDRSRPAPG